MASTTLWVKKETKALLDKIGKKGESYDTIIRRLIGTEEIIPIKIKRPWYRQGVEGVPFFMTHPMMRIFYLLGERDSFYFNIKTSHYGYWEVNKARAKATAFFEKEIKTGTLLGSTIREWRKVVTALESIYNEIDKTTPKQKKKLKELLLSLLSLFDPFWDPSLIHEFFDPVSDELVIDLLKQNPSPKISVKEFKKLCMPTVLSAAQKELYDFYTAMQTEKGLAQHAGKYYWIQTGWAGSKPLDIHFFKEKKARLLDEHVDPKKEKKKLDDFLEELDRDKKDILKKHKLSPRLRDAAAFFQRMSSWREERKVASSKINYYLDVWLTKYLDGIAFEKKLAYFATPEEVLLQKPTSAFKKELLERSKTHVLFAKHDKPTFVTGPSAEHWIRRFRQATQPKANRLYGSVANPGKAEGIVNIILTVEDMKQFHKGNILIAPMTRPEYLPAMKKAAAIVTEEGGITSHAAIVSRELGVPCVVGVQHATQVFTDEDSVFVNADHGIVEKKT